MADTVGRLAAVFLQKPQPRTGNPSRVRLHRQGRRWRQTCGTTETLPLLEVIAEHDVDHGPVKRQQDLVALAGGDSRQVQRSLDRLYEGDMIAAVVSPMMSGGASYGQIRPTTAGRRVVGQWPSGDVAEALVAALEARIADATDPDERDKWQAVRDNMRSLGISAVASMLVEAGKFAGGI